MEQQIRQGFLDEARETLENIEEILLELAPGQPEPDVIARLFRHMHNLKGSAASMGLSLSVRLIHVAEQLVSQIQKGEAFVTDEKIRLLVEVNDVLGRCYNALTLESFEEQIDCEDLIARIAAEGNESDTGAAPGDGSNTSARDPYTKLQEAQAGDVIFADELDQAAPAPQPQRKTPSSEAQGNGLGKATNQTLRVSLPKVDALSDLSSEQQILIDAVRFELNNSPANSDPLRVHSLMEKLCRTSQELQNRVMALRLVPLSTISPKIKRVVRDTSQQVAKQVQLVIQGDHLEIDKTLLDLLNAPLNHIIRNAIDHGLESPEEREQLGKDKEGRLSIDAKVIGSRIRLTIRDDGKGVDTKAIVKKARRLGILSEEETPSHEQCLELLFHSGFSTREEASEISGRGVGLDSVREVVRNLNGTVSISSETGKGTTFQVEIPTNFGVVEGFVLKRGQKRYVISVDEVKECLAAANYLNTSVQQEGSEILKIRDEKIRCFHLGQLLGETPATASPTLIITPLSGDRFVGIFVDEVETQIKVAAKALPRDLSNRPGHVGIAILWDGQPAPIVSLTKLVSNHLSHQERQYA